MWRCLFITFWVFALSVSSALANPDIRGLLISGDYETARIEAEALETANGYALAAEALNAQILLGEIDDLNKAAKASLDLAQQALAIEPSNANARLQEALAYGFVTRTTGNFKAWRKKLPQKTFDKAKALQEDYPNDARALALLAAWHLGVIQKAGAKNGGKWFGASLEVGKDLYQSAMQLDPHDILIATNYYMALTALDLEISPVHNKAALENILGLTPRSDVDKKVQAQARTMLSILGDRKAEIRLAENFLDGEFVQPAPRL